MKRKKICVVFGTRPELIKLSGICRLAMADTRVWDLCAINTGQHKEMVDTLLPLFEVDPKYRLDLMSDSTGLNSTLALALTRLDPIFKEEQPDWVIVQGDTTTCLAGTIAAFHLGIRVAHVEAGLRSGDMLSPFPEEFNRRAVSLVATHHFSPTEVAAQNLLQEGVPASHVAVTGNTGIDSLFWVEKILAERRGPIVEPIERRFSRFLGMQRNSGQRLVLLTLHRRESFGEPLRQLVAKLVELAKTHPQIRMLWPVHPNPEVRRLVHQYTDVNDGNSAIETCDPLNYAEMVYLLSQSHFVITDSGGLQEEAPSLGKPVLVVRETTERPEAIEAGAAVLVGRDPAALEREFIRLVHDESHYQQMAQRRGLFGDGSASQRILDRLRIRTGDE